MREIAETRMRYGYPRIHVLLRRKDWDVDANCVYRFNKELGLQLRVKAKLIGAAATSCSN
jgi:putative transposase